MSESDMAVYNQVFKNIDRPYANIDLTKVPSWDLVMSIMEQQAIEARKQMLAKYSHPDQVMPKTITKFEYQSSPYNYSQNGGSSTEESDASSVCSEELMSTTATSSQSDVSHNDSDIEIDVDSIEEENDDFFVPSLDNIPITVLQLETRLREKERHQS